MTHHFDTGAFVGAGGWHSLGRVLRESEAPTSTLPMLQLAGCAWPVRLAPIMLVEQQNEPGWQALPGQAIIREDTREPLAIVGTSYSSFQNTDLAPILDPLLETGRWRFDTMCSLKGGRVVLANLVDIRGASGDIVPGDSIRQRLLVSTTHDGTGLVRVRPTAIRDVCWNTYSASLSEHQPEAKLRHTGDVRARAVMIGKTLEQGDADIAKTIEFMRAAAHEPLDRATLQAYVRAVLKPVEVKAEIAARERFDLLSASGGREIIEAREALEEASKKAQHRAESRIEELFDGDAVGSALAGRTLWGALNAVTQWVERERGGDGWTRLHASQLGAGANIRHRAMVTAANYLQSASMN